MELSLESMASTCCVSAAAFQTGERVVSFLGRDNTGAVVRRDLLASEEPRFETLAFVFCRWVRVYKPRDKNENPERDLRLSAESLFLALADPANEPSPENASLVRFLALMLERKKILRPRGATADGTRQIFEHAKSHLTYEVPNVELSDAFFIRVQEQLGVLVGEPKPKSPPTTPPPAASAEAAPAQA